MNDYKDGMILGAAVLLLCLYLFANKGSFIKKLDDIKRTVINKFFKYVNAILKHKWMSIIIWMLIAWLVGIYGYLETFPKNLDMPFVWSESAYMSWCSAALWSIVNMMYQTSGNLNNGYIVFSKIMAIIGLVITIALTFLKNILENVKLDITKQITHSLVIGLGENNRYYLDSEKKAGNEEKIIIIEKDAENDYIETYKNKGFGVFIGRIEDYQINFSKLERIVISGGDDMNNLEIAGDIISNIPDNNNETTSKSSTTIHIHLKNHDLKGLLGKELFKKKSHKIEFRSYSFDDDAVRELFEKHTILGNFHELADRSTGYDIVVVGDGDLAERVIYHLCMQTALPNRNHCTIHCITPDADRFIARLRAKLIGIDQIDWVTLQMHSVEYSSVDFFTSKVWNKNFLTNIIVCDNDEGKNLEMIINLHEKVFLKMAVSKMLRTKIHFAIYHNTELGLAISSNEQNEYEQFFAFGNAQSICSREHFIGERYENIAKLIHSGYGDSYDPLKLGDLQGEMLIEKWLDQTTFTKRESNRSQALHINTKLMSMGLRKIMKPDVDRNTLLESNRKIMKSFLMPDEKLKDISAKLYSKNSDDHQEMSTFFDYVINSEELIYKLAKAEHDRWSAFHYLNNWTHNLKRNDDCKEHNCLIALEKFGDFDMMQTIVYDLYSIQYIPNYLANAGYEIVSY